MANFNNALITTAIQTYIDQTSAKEIKSEIVLNSHTAEIVSKLSTKYGVSIPIITSQPVITGAACGILSGTGSVTLQQATLQVSPLMMQEDICQNGQYTMEDIWMNMQAKSGSYYDTLEPNIFAKVYVQDKYNKISIGNEYLLWAGYGGGTPYSGAVAVDGVDLSQVTGFLYQLEQSANSTQINTTTYSLSSWTSVPQYSTSTASAFYVVDALYNNLLNQVPQIAEQTDLYAFMSLSNYRIYLQDLRNKNWYFSEIQADVRQAGAGASKGGERTLPWSIYHFGSNLIVAGIAGMTGINNKIVLGKASYLYMGYDLESDAMNFKIEEVFLTNSIMFRALWKLGTAVIYPQYFLVATGL